MHVAQQAPTPEPPPGIGFKLAGSDGTLKLIEAVAEAESAPASCLRAEHCVSPCLGCVLHRAHPMCSLVEDLTMENG